MRPGKYELRVPVAGFNLVKEGRRMVRILKVRAQTNPTQSGKQPAPKGWLQRTTNNRQRTKAEVLNESNRTFHFIG
jgi:hypothetical protein